MSEADAGVRKLLSQASAYELLQTAVGSNASHRRFLEEHVRPVPGTRLLDVGCGPGHVLRSLPADCEYVGFDASPEYIAAARRNWGYRGEFHCLDLQAATFDDATFDVVIAMGLLHHLDDAACTSFFDMAAHALKPEGRLVAIDPAYADAQPRVARWLIARDRGDHVRTTDGYARLAGSSFGRVTACTRGDLLRIPYTHAVLECAEPRAASAVSRSASS